MQVKLIRRMIGAQPVVGIVSPFSAKDAVKSSGVVSWQAIQKFWACPFTRLAVDQVVSALKRAFPDAQVDMDDDVRRLIGDPPLPTRVEEISPVYFGAAVRPQWRHQPMGVAQMLQLEGSGLDWDMGSGKTKTVYDAIQCGELAMTLVLCPSSVVSVWDRQQHMHVAPQFRERFRGIYLTGDYSIKRRAAFLHQAVSQMQARAQAMLMVVTNYEAAWRDELAAAICQYTWDLVVLDESHRISNHTTRINKFLSKSLRPRARRRVGLTGTPMGGGPIDIFGQMLFLDPGLFGESIGRFRDRFCVMGGFEGRKVVNYRNIEEFTKIMSRVWTKVRLKDVVELPEFTDEEIAVDIGVEGRKAYASLRDELVVEHEKGTLVASNALTKLLRLQQITSGYMPVVDEDQQSHIIPLHDGKSSAFKELLGDIGGGEPVVVFCKFVADLQAVKRVATELDRPCWEISGAGNQQKEWERDAGLGLGPVVAVQIQSGGVGIDLTLARYCFYYSLGFSLTEYDQSRARVHRPGQTRGVLYYHLIAPGTVDRVVYSALKAKRKVVDAVLEDLISASNE